MIQEYTRLCKGGMGKISRSKLEEGGSDELEALRGEFSQDMLTPEFPVEPDVADVEVRSMHPLYLVSARIWCLELTFPDFY